VKHNYDLHFRQFSLQLPDMNIVEKFVVNDWDVPKYLKGICLFYIELKKSESDCRTFFTVV